VQEADNDMRKRKPWHKLWVIVLASIILLPLGLFLLWRSPRSIRAKVVISVILVSVLTGVGVGVVTTGTYARLTNDPEPLEGFDVSMDSRGNYKVTKIFPLERKVFNAVVIEMRRAPNRQAVVTEELATIEGMPEGKAYQAVAEEFGLGVPDVEAIYLKVSSQLAKTRR